MRELIRVIFVLVSLGLSTTCRGEAVADIYLSFSDFGDGNAAMNTTATKAIGETGSLFVWVNDTIDIDTGVFLDVDSDRSDTIHFVDAKVFNPDIVSSASSDVVGTRWSATGPGTVTDDAIDELRGFRVLSGTGILSGQTSDAGNSQVDIGHDASSDAFLFARIDFEVLAVGDTTIGLTEGAGLIVDGGRRVEPTFGAASIAAVAIPEPTFTGLLMLPAWVVRRRTNLL